MEIKTGATGASPAPTQGAGSSAPAATPAASTPGASPTPASSGADRKAKVAEFAGKAATGADQEKSQDQATPPPTNDAGTGDLTPEQVFEKYGKTIFEHERFKSLAEYKAQTEPFKQLVDSFQGGFDSLKQFTEFLGPVWNHFLELGQADPQKATERWNLMAPFIHALVSGEEISMKTLQRLYSHIPGTDPQAGADEPSELDERLNPLKKDLDDLKSEREQEKQERIQRERVEQANRAKDTAVQYLTEFDRILADNKITKPAAKKYAWDLMLQDIVNHTERSPDGRPVNPLMKYNPAALKKCIETYVLPQIRELNLSVIDEASDDTKNLGPAIPSTARGNPILPSTPAPSTRSQAIDRMVQRTQNSRLGFK